MKKGKPLGRPSKYSDELADEICGRIASGESLIRICKDIPIDYSTVADWLLDPRKASFAKKYAQAREAQADYLADDILDISSDATIPPDDRRVRIDARKWYAGKLRPKKYGDKVQVSGDEENPVHVKGSLTLTPDEAYRRMLNGDK